MKVFLGGTCNGSKWRDEAIIYLQDVEMDFFNPVVDDWTDEAQKQEIIERENCDFCLYVITPRMVGTYAIAEAVDDSNKRPEKTVFVFLSIDMEDFFTTGQIKSLISVGALIERNGGAWKTTIHQAVEYMAGNSSGVIK